MIQMLLVNTTLADHSMKKMESETTESFVVSFEWRVTTRVDKGWEIALYFACETFGHDVTVRCSNYELF